MKYASIKKNDVANGEGINVSFYVQGCPHHCYKCFNPETWNFEGGKDFTPETLKEILDAISANGIKRNLAILGGEPLCKENEFLTFMVINAVKEKYPDIKITIWTGYTLEHLLKNSYPKTKKILETIDCLVDGPYIEEERDVSLFMRGSRNQRVLYKGKDF